MQVPVRDKSFATLLKAKKQKEPNQALHSKYLISIFKVPFLYTVCKRKGIYMEFFHIVI